MGRLVRRRVGIRPAREAARALRVLYRALGINLDAEFAELAREIPITNDHSARWGTTT